MKILMTSAVLAIALWAVWAVTRLQAEGGSTHTCNAPCIVKFPQPMAEDMFWIDYRGDGTVRVYCSDTDNRFHELRCGA